MDDTERRDKDRVIMALSFLALFVLWFVFIGILLIVDADMDKTQIFGLGSVTGVLCTILTLVFQFFFRTSGDKETKETKDGS